jgi:Ser/Thr protein kinase RdoA (MazF antagonist)
MHAGNFFITDKGDITVFDFDDACYSFYLYDAMILFAVENLKEKNLTNPTPEEYQDIYLKAFADELGITNLDKLRHDLKNFERLRSIEMYAWVYLMGYDKDNDMDAWRKKFTPDVPFKNYSA